MAIFQIPLHLHPAPPSPYHHYMNTLFRREYSRRGEGRDGGGGGKRTGVEKQGRVGRGGGKNREGVTEGENR